MQLGNEETFNVFPRFQVALENEGILPSGLQDAPAIVRVMRRSRQRFPFSANLVQELRSDLGLPEDMSDYDRKKLFGSPEKWFFWKHFSYSGRNLYHYTRQDAFISMLGNRSSRVSNVRHFNDYSEVEYAYGVLRALIEEIKKDATYGLEPGFLAQLLKDALPNRHDSYVLCFSTKYDDLNQWRSYASPGLGYCIGFPCHLLSAIAETYKGRLGQCIYSRKHQSQIVSAMLTDALWDLSTYFPHYDPGEINEGLVQARTKAFSEHFSTIAPLFKNPAFAEESEVRLVFDVEAAAIPVHFRSGATSIVPYIELSFQISDLQALSPNAVVVKTCSRPEFVTSAVRKFLDSAGYEKVVISASGIPFREGL